MAGGFHFGLRGLASRMEKIAAACLLLCPAAAQAQERAERVLPALTNDVALVADWQGEYRLDVAAGPGGSVAGTAGGWHDVGTVVSNVATPDAVCVFAGWSHAPAGLEAENPLVFALDGPCTNLVANFALRPAAFQLGVPEGGAPGLAVPEFPAGFTAIVQRCTGGLVNAVWQDTGACVYGTTNWNDTTATGQWTTLFYRLAE